MNPRLHILGAGDAPEQLLEAAIEDQLTAVAFNPIDIEFWTLEGIQVPSLETLAKIIQDCYTGLGISWRKFPEESFLLSEFRNSLRTLDGNHLARVLVLWDESSITRQVVQVALDQKVEVYDLSDALTRIGSLAPQDNNDKTEEKPPMATAQTRYTKDQLLEMTDEEIVPLAEAYGIDHASFPEWDPVIDLILEAQGEEALADGSEGAYTREELEALELDTLKEICKANEIPVEGQRPRAMKYIEAILAFQEANTGPEPTMTGEASSNGAAGNYSGEDIAGLLGKLQGDISFLADSQNAVVNAVNEGLKRLTDEVAAMREAVAKLVGLVVERDKVSGGSSPQAAKAVSKAAAPVRKITRPSA